MPPTQQARTEAQEPVLPGGHTRPRRTARHVLRGEQLTKEKSLGASQSLASPRRQTLSIKFFFQSSFLIIQVSFLQAIDLIFLCVVI